MHMLHHISFGVSNLGQSAEFYDAALSVLGYERVWSDFEGDPETQAVGYGLRGGEDKLALKQCKSAQLAPGPSFHLALTAPDRASVDRFHAAALRTGGKDDGPPGLRPDYGPNYYAAYVIDPDGYRIEAVINAAA